MEETYTIYFKNNNKEMMIFCTKKDLDKTLRKIKKSSWLTDIKVVKHEIK
jgi:uncharacterized protein YlbG (UPF0298 family)